MRAPVADTGRTRSRSLVPSQFTVRLQDADRVVWFNSATGSSLRLRPEQSRALERFLGSCPASDGGAGLVDGLARLGFLVPEADDEFAREHGRYLDACRDDRRLLLCIAPTLACNVRCSYCFQRELERLTQMGPEIVRSLLEFVEAASDGLEQLAVQWYGGEPLLSLKLIRTLTEQLRRLSRERGFTYHARMVTNGLLLARNDCWRELGDLAISTVQIPLDGLPRTYARHRGVSLRRAESFYAFLLTRVDEMLASIDKIVIRINVDRDNIDEACQVVDLFADAGVTNRRLEFLLGRLHTTPGMSECIPHDCLRPQDFQDAEVSFRNHLVGRGYQIFDRPGPVGWPCGAPLRSYFSVDPAGRLGTCIPATGSTRATFATLRLHDAAGTMAEARSTARPFGSFDPFEAESCRRCPLLPSCLGSCPEHRSLNAAQYVSGSCPARRELEHRIITASKT